MAKKSSIPFQGTPEQKAQLDAVIAENKHDPSLLMRVMQKAQDIYGYLPQEVQVMIAEGLDVPLTKVYGIVTFYSQFSMEPKGKIHIAVCMGTACYVKSANLILEDIEKRTGCKAGGITEDGVVSIEATRCIGACGLAPIITVNEDVYGNLALEDVGEIMAKYLKK